MNTLNTFNTIFSLVSCLDTIVEQGSANTWNKERNRDKASNKSQRQNQGNNAAAIWQTSGNKEDGKQQAAAANSPGIWQMCDICGGYFEHPVTYHMRMAHPGCGGHAGGRGYNSGGQYCGGWAGNCGDGGVGGSSWYLICEVCKEKHSKGHLNKANKLKDGPRKASALSDQLNLKQSQPFVMPVTSMMASFSKATVSSPTGQMDCHMIMKANSMFLLDLASSSAEETKGRKRLTSSSGPSLATVSEINPGDPGSFPYTQFHCLDTLGVQDHQLRELNEELMMEEQWRRGDYEDSRSSAETVRCQPQEAACQDKDSDKPDANPESQGIEPPSEFQEGPGGGVVYRRNKFHRSVSIGSPRGKEWSPTLSSNARILTNRKRNSSHEDSGDHHHISTAGNYFLAPTCRQEP